MNAARRIFASLKPPINQKAAAYSAEEISSAPNCLVAKDKNENPALLIRTAKVDYAYTTIELRNISLRLNVDCVVEINQERNADTFAILLCKDNDEHIIEMFLGIAGDWIQTLTLTPTSKEIRKAFCTLSDLFQSLELPSKGTTLGLWGEALLIAASKAPEALGMAWHDDPQNLFDFCKEIDNIEIKTTSGPIRSHYFSLRQLSPPRNSELIIVSIIAPQDDNGLSVRDLIDFVKKRIPHMALKIEAVSALTLGSDWRKAYSHRYDISSAISSIRFFNWAQIPTVDRKIPETVSEVGFRSNLEGIESLRKEDLDNKGIFLSSAFPSSSQVRLLTGISTST
jgi:hypothetical protein